MRSDELIDEGYKLLLLRHALAAYLPALELRLRDTRLGIAPDAPPVEEQEASIAATREELASLDARLKTAGPEVLS